MIERIQIANFKGIGNYTPNLTYDLELRPIRPHILFAPNGFGKSSMAPSFNRLRPTKSVFERNDYFKNDETNKLIYSENGVNQTTLVANENSNQFRKKFDWFVINSQLFAKAKKEDRKRCYCLSIS